MSEGSATSVVVIEDALLTEAVDFYAKTFTMSSGDKRDVNGIPKNVLIIQIFVSYFKIHIVKSAFHICVLFQKMYCSFKLLCLISKYILSSQAFVSYSTRGIVHSNFCVLFQKMYCSFKLLCLIPKDVLFIQVFVSYFKIHIVKSNFSYLCLIPKNV